MAKTTILNDNSALTFGYEVDTAVKSSQFLMNNATPPAAIGVKVYPQTLGGIVFSTLLEIGGVGQVVVSGIGSDALGPFFTYSQLSAPQAGAYIHTPWLFDGTYFYTRTRNSISLTYYNPTKHDLYFRTQRASDSGALDAVVDGVDLGAIPISNPTPILDSVLLRSNISSGTHTVTVTAQFPGTSVFVYFYSFEMLEQVVETGGEYLSQGPTGNLDDSTNNFLGQWGATGGYAYTTDTTARVFFYPQLTVGGQAQIRLQKTPDSGIVSVYANGVFRSSLDLYADPAEPLFQITLLDQGAGDAAGVYEIELRHSGTKNPSSSGLFFYFHSVVVVYSRTDNDALILAANYLKKVATLRGDGAFPDAWDSEIVNFDATSLYACMGLLAAYTALGDSSYLDCVKNFLVWFSGLQDSDGSWSIGYQIDPALSPPYQATSGPYAPQGISEIRWVDAVQCLPTFVLWWYWQLSSDDATKNALLPVFRKGIDGFIGKNYDSATGFFFSSWQNKTSPTIFIYHDGIRRYSADGALLEQHDDAESFFTYSDNWSSYSAPGAIGNDEHYTLSAGSYVQFSIALGTGEEVRWVTQSAWDAGISEILVSTDGSSYAAAGMVDTYAATLTFQREFPLYTAPAAATYWFRIQHSGTINPLGNDAPGWQRLASRFSAGQTDVSLGLYALWLFSREPKYAALAGRVIGRFAASYWDDSEGRWLISLDGPAPGTGNDFWYPMTHGYTVFGQSKSRLFRSKQLLSEGLRALEPFQDSEGGFNPPGYLEAEYIFSAFYLLGQNQLAAPTNAPATDLAKQYIKSGQYLLNIGGDQVGGIVFSKRYQYLYTNITGIACLALSGISNPISEQLKLGATRMLIQR